MKFYSKLSSESIRKMSNKYMLDLVNADSFEIKGQTVFVKLDYYGECHYHPVAEIFGPITKENIEGFKKFFNKIMKGNV